jgi:hypothetical protein
MHGGSRCRALARSRALTLDDRSIAARRAPLPSRERELAGELSLDCSAKVAERSGAHELRTYGSFSRW